MRPRFRSGFDVLSSLICSLSSVVGSLLSSDSFRIEYRPLAGAVAAQRALVADRVGTLEDPVLPCGETREDFRFHGLRPAKPEIGLETSEPVRRNARALLQKNAQLVIPIDLVERKAYEAERLGSLTVEHLAALGLGSVEVGRIGKKAARQPGN